MSSICAMGSLLVSFAACANGIVPVLDLDFTRSATETLKKMGINDACVIRASNPVSFTYCREGSSTLWKYQDLDLTQLAAINGDKKMSPAAAQQISVLEFNSAICEHEGAATLVKPTMARWLAFSLLALFVLLGLRYTYQTLRPRRHDLNACSNPGLLPLNETLPRFNPSKKAATALGIALALALVCFSYLGF